jgi:hypothetical protein
VAGGLSVAPGGGTSESPSEPAGAPAATTEPATSQPAAEPATSEPGGAHLSGSINLDDETPEGGGESQPGTEGSA